MKLTYIPTELEIQLHAAKIHPNSKSLQSSFIQGVHNTIYYSKSN